MTSADGAERQTCLLPAYYNDLKDKVRSGLVEGIGETGLRVRADGALPQGTEVAIRTHLGDSYGALALSGRVRSCEPLGEAGSDEEAGAVLEIRFDRLPVDAKERLQLFAKDFPGPPPLGPTGSPRWPIPAEGPLPPAQPPLLKLEAGSWVSTPRETGPEEDGSAPSNLPVEDYRELLAELVTEVGGDSIELAYRGHRLAPRVPAPLTTLRAGIEAEDGAASLLLDALAVQMRAVDDLVWIGNPLAGMQFLPLESLDEARSAVDETATRLREASGESAELARLVGTELGGLARLLAQVVWCGRASLGLDEDRRSQGKKGTGRPARAPEKKEAAADGPREVVVGSRAVQLPPPPPKGRGSRPSRSRSPAARTRRRRARRRRAPPGPGTISRATPARSSSRSR